ncbi:MAG: NAD-dependent succinate-semialdehyde dehydrogenase, partial [Candidatus Acidiferrum sp.]
MTKSASIATELKDPRLFREACYVDGQWIQASSGQTMDVDNPATKEIIGKVPKLSGVEARCAIKAAKNAFPAWSSKTAKERAAVLRRWFELLMSNQEDLARLMTLEQGKPLAESRGEVAYAAAFLEWFAEEAKRVYGDTIPQHQADKRIVVVKQPIGVVACITPWNFPLAMITRKAGPAIGSGCTVVVKPAEQTPFSALALAELAERAGVPKGVLNIVTGAPEEIGAELTSSSIVRKLSFTGSTEVGKILMAQCAGNIKKVSLELGGNAPFIVFEDANLDAAVEGAIASKYRNTGQTCVCSNRFLIQEGVYDAFAAKLADAVKKLKPAPGLEVGATQG